MSLVVGTILSFLFLEPPWRYLALIPLAAWEAVEVVVFLRWRGAKSITGAETLAGERGVATTDCDPDGQVQVRGQLWTAHCPEGARKRDAIEVLAHDGLKLVVARRRD